LAPWFPRIRFALHVPSDPGDPDQLRTLTPPQCPVKAVALGLAALTSAQAYTRTNRTGIWRPSRAPSVCRARLVAGRCTNDAQNEPAYAPPRADSWKQKSSRTSSALMLRNEGERVAADRPDARFATRSGTVPGDRYGRPAPVLARTSCAPRRRPWFARGLRGLGDDAVEIAHDRRIAQFAQRPPADSDRRPAVPSPQGRRAACGVAFRR
jgi:hypothetical protein